jgi:hypothetical protein
MTMTSGPDGRPQVRAFLSEKDFKNEGKIYLQISFLNDVKFYYTQSLS